MKHYTYNIINYHITYLQIRPLGRAPDGAKAQMTFRISRSHVLCKMPSASFLANGPNNWDPNDARKKNRSAEVSQCLWNVSVIPFM